MSDARTRNILLGVIATILVLAALRAAQSVAIPVVLGGFVALIVSPIDDWLRQRLPDSYGWVGMLAATLSILAALAAFAGAVWLAASQVSGALGDVQGRIDEMQDQTDGITVFGKTLAQLAAMVSERAISEMSGVAETILKSTGMLISGLIIVIFVVALMLSERSRVVRAIDHLLDDGAEESLEDTVATIAHKLRVYLAVRLLMGVISAVIYTAWLALFGLDLLLVWAILTVLLNFIPNLGSVISGSLPVLYALVTKDPAQIAMMAAGLFVIEQIIGNFIDPKVQGHQIALSPVVILLGLLVWGWIWGVPGALMATPISIAIVVTCAHLRGGEAVALLLSNATTRDELRDRATGEA